MVESYVKMRLQHSSSYANPPLFLDPDLRELDRTRVRTFVGYAPVGVAPAAYFSPSADAKRLVGGKAKDSTDMAVDHLRVPQDDDMTQPLYPSETYQAARRAGEKRSKAIGLQKGGGSTASNRQSSSPLREQRDCRARTEGGAENSE